MLLPRPARPEAGPDVRSGRSRSWQRSMPQDTVNKASQPLSNTMLPYPYATTRSVGHGRTEVPMRDPLINMDGFWRQVAFFDSSGEQRAVTRMSSIVVSRLGDSLADVQTHCLTSCQPWSCSGAKPTAAADKTNKSDARAPKIEATGPGYHQIARPTTA